MQVGADLFHFAAPHAGDSRSQIVFILRRDAIQSAVTSGVLDTLYDTLLLVGMSSLMLYLDWRFTLIALSIVFYLGFIAWYSIRSSLAIERT